MRGTVSAVVLWLSFTSGCGYIGPVVPPSPYIPTAVIDLSAVERGDTLVVTFTAPAATTDALAIQRFSDIDLRLGPDVQPFDSARWEANARRYEVALPPVTDMDDPKPSVTSKAVPISEWLGKRIAIAVRTAVKGENRFSQWSKPLVLDVVPPLKPPEVTWTATPGGYRLTWTAQRPGLHYQVFRSSPTDKSPIALAVTEQPEYVDATSQWDVPYSYTVVAQEGVTAESLPSKPARAFSADTFAPSVPAALNVLAGPEAVELSWTRSPEPDLKGYLVYRSINNGPFLVVSELVPLPAFSDRKVEHNHTYRYAISSVDMKGNESDKSPPAEVTF